MSHLRSEVKRFITNRLQCMLLHVHLVTPLCNINVARVVIFFRCYFMIFFKISLDYLVSFGYYRVRHTWKHTSCLLMRWPFAIFFSQLHRFILWRCCKHLYMFMCCCWWVYLSPMELTEFASSKAPQISLESESLLIGSLTIHWRG